MLQKEVVDRMAAAPGQQGLRPADGDAAVALRRSSRLFDVPPEAFEPPPRVDSAVLRMTPLADAARRRSGAAARARHGRLLAAAQAPAPHPRPLARRARRADRLRPAAPRRRGAGRRMDRPRRRAPENDPEGVGPSLSEGGERSGEGAALTPSRRVVEARATPRSTTSPCRTRCSSAACSCRNCCSPPSWRRLDRLVAAVDVADSGGHFRRPLP